MKERGIEAVAEIATLEIGTGVEIEATVGTDIIMTVATLEAEAEIVPEEKKNLFLETMILVNQTPRSRQLELQSSKHGNSKNNSSR